MRVGPYVLGSPIGSGATGIVYDAWRDDLQRRVAVKQLHPQLAARQDFVERFRAEARVPPPPAPPGAQPPLSWAPPADPRVRVLEAASRGGAVRAVASLAGALAVLAGGLGVARSGAGSLTSAPATLRTQVDGSGTATSPGPRSSGSCGTVDLAFTFTVRGSASEVAEVAGKAFVALITATAPASPLDGRLVSTPIDSAGRAALTFAGAAVPPGGASWSARPVRLGELPVDEAATHAVTVTATCTLT